MAQQSSGRGPAPGPERGGSADPGDSQGARLDRLEQRVAELAQSVEAGLVAQARRVESVVGTTRRELVDAIQDHSGLVDATTRAVRDVLGRARPGGADDSPAEAGEGDTRDGQLRDELQQNRLTFREGLRRDAEELQERLRDDVRSVRAQRA